MTRITGQQARELLDAVADEDAMFATPPWEEYVTVGAGAGESRMSILDARCDMVADVYEPDALPLIAAAPVLAATVAWLYGAEGQEADNGWRRWPLGRTWSVGLRDGYISIGPEGGGLGFWDLDAAENAARALLSAVEEARRGE